jgi:hypothetical protein
MILMFALRDSAATNVTMPSGWYYGGNNAGLNTDNLTVGWKNALTSSEVSSTWTNADFLVAVVYRPTTNWHFAALRTASRSVLGGSDSFSYSAANAVNVNVVAPVLGSMQAAESVILGFAASASSAVSLNVVPADMTNRLVATGASSRQIVVHDTGVVSSRTGGSVTLSGVTPWLSGVIHLVDIKVPIESGGSSRPVNPFFQQVIG